MTMIIYWCFKNMARPPLSLPPTTTKPLQVSLLLGSFEYDPVELQLFDLVLPESLSAPFHPDEVSYHLQPEIHHTFRPDPTSPPRIISAVFSAVVLAPWVVLLGLVSKARYLSGRYWWYNQWASIPHPLPHLFNPAVLSFVSLLTAFEGLLLWYWVALKLGEVLAYGAVLSIVTAAAGKYALSNIARWRISAGASK